MEETPKIYRLEDFTPLVGQNFTLSQEGIEETIEGELIEAEASPYPSHPDAARDPFSLLFRLDPIYETPQIACTISHDTLGSIPVLLVPVNSDDKGYYMETIFS